jgi:hypothetical protein
VSRGDSSPAAKHGAPGGGGGNTGGDGGGPGGGEALPMSTWTCMNELAQWCDETSTVFRSMSCRIPLKIP